MRIPKQVSGRIVTNRGAHLHPFGFHNEWMKNLAYWVELLQKMHMSWVVALSEDDAILISGAAEALLDAGIIPIVRFSYQFPKHWTVFEPIEDLVELYSRYDAPLIVQFANEPFDSREWIDGKVPSPDIAWSIIRDRWWEASNIIVDLGAIAGFPDGPSYGRNPFEVIGDNEGYWYDGKAVYLGHHYGKGRPRDFPGAVSWLGDQPQYQLTREQYEEALDDYAGDPAWNELIHYPGFLDLMNKQRREWALTNRTLYPEGITPIQDDVCYRGWEKVQWWAKQAFGFKVQMALTEGGWVPRDRAGTGGNTDIRWPMTTPKMVAKKTLAIMNERPSPFFAICPWLLACSFMGGSGWEFDAWVGWAYSEKYGWEKPVVQMLSDNPPPDYEPCPKRTLAITKTQRIRQLVLEWREKYD